MAKKDQPTSDPATEESTEHMKLVLESAEALFRQIATRAEDTKWFPHGVTKIDLDIKAGPGSNCT